MSPSLIDPKAQSTFRLVKARRWYVMFFSDIECNISKKVSINGTIWRPYSEKGFNMRKPIQWKPIVIRAGTAVENQMMTVSYLNLIANQTFT